MHASIVVTIGLLVLSAAAHGQMIGDWRWGAGGVNSPYNGETWGNYARDEWHAVPQKDAVATGGRAFIDNMDPTNWTDDRFYNCGVVTNLSGARCFTVTFEDVCIHSASNSARWVLMGAGSSGVNSPFYVDIAKVSGSDPRLFPRFVAMDPSGNAKIYIFYSPLVTKDVETNDFQFVFDGRGTPRIWYRHRASHQPYWPHFTWKEIDPSITRMNDLGTTDVLIGKYAWNSSAAGNMSIGRVTLDMTDPERLFPDTTFGQWLWQGDEALSIQPNSGNPLNNHAVLNGQATVSDGVARVGLGTVGNHIDFGFLGALQGTRRFIWTFNDLVFENHTSSKVHYLLGGISGGTSPNYSLNSWGAFEVIVSDTHGNSRVTLRLWGEDAAAQTVLNGYTQWTGLTLTTNVAYDLSLLFDGTRNNAENVGMRIRDGASMEWGAWNYRSNSVVRISTNRANQSTVLGQASPSTGSLGSDISVGSVTVDIPWPPPPPPGTILLIQ